MNIYAYFDESGTHKGSQALSVAGFLGKADEWGAFTFEWEGLLKEFQVEFFHMATFENRQGVYSDWSDDRRRDFMQRVLAVINRHVLGSVGTIIPLSDYDAIFPEDGIPEGPNIQMLAPGIWAPGSERPRRDSAAVCRSSVSRGQAAARPAARSQLHYHQIVVSPGASLG